LTPKKSKTAFIKLKSIVEKPKYEDAPSNMAVIGRYIFTPELFGAIEQIEPGAGGEYQVADAMRILLDKDFPFYATKLDGVATTRATNSDF
jgi:UTP--glucose-1-phosphate uridylyltransferase